MRTTVRIKDSLLKKAKEFAAKNGTTLTFIIEDSLKEVLYRDNAKKKSPPVKFRIAKGGGTLPGVDLNDNSSLLSIMESQ